PIDLYRAIHDRKQCAGCYYVYEYGQEQDDEENIYQAISKYGMYHYACCEDQMAVPYGRMTIPERPLEVEQLPADLQDELAKVHFADLSFAETPYIQPAQRVQSYSWDGGYLREDWKTYQANPGQEKEYAELYKAASQGDYYGDFDFQPPGS